MNSGWKWEIVIMHNDITYNNNIHIIEHKNVKKKIKQNDFTSVRLK